MFLSNPLLGFLRYLPHCCAVKTCFSLLLSYPKKYVRSASFSNLFSVFFTSYYVKSSWKVSTFTSHCPYFVTDGLFYVMKDVRKKWVETLFHSMLPCVLENWLFIGSYSFPRELHWTSAEETVLVLDECKVRWKIG